MTAYVPVESGSPIKLWRGPDYVVIKPGDASATSVIAARVGGTTTRRTLRGLREVPDADIRRLNGYLWTEQEMRDAFASAPFSTPGASQAITDGRGQGRRRTTA